MKSFFIIVGLLTLVYSCDNASKYEAELTQIENNLLTLDSIATDINGIEFDSLVYMQVEAEKNEKTIKMYYAPDTIDMIFAEKLNMNKSVRKSLNSISTQKENLLTEVDTLKFQFNNLSNDILKGHYTKEQITEYLNIENLSLDNLSLSFKNLFQNQIKQKKNFYYANPQIKEYADLLRDEFENK
jgi:hypothetical protein